jgi:primase-polymerase (primpol)-like protein
VALAHQRNESRWVVWAHRLKNGRWTKPPIDPRTGRMASVDNPDTWGTFDVALAAMERHELAGVGLVLTGDDNMIGIDLDDCISDSDGHSSLAAEVVSYGETYAEISPSGEGIRIFARGKIESALKDDELGIEIYSAGRYLTVTGRQISNAPDCIAEAPRTLARLKAAVVAKRNAKSQRKPNGQPPGGGDFFANVNAARASEA